MRLSTLRYRVSKFHASVDQLLCHECSSLSELDSQSRTFVHRARHTSRVLVPPSIGQCRHDVASEFHCLGKDGASGTALRVRETSFHFSHGHGLLCLSF